MDLYIEKVKTPMVVEAYRWLKNGDHPEDGSTNIKCSNGTIFKSEGNIVRYFRHPDISGKSKCLKCGKTMHVHGWIDSTISIDSENGEPVCPGDWVIRYESGKYTRMPNSLFSNYYNRFTDVLSYVKEHNKKCMGKRVPGSTCKDPKNCSNKKCCCGGHSGKKKINRNKLRK